MIWRWASWRKSARANCWEAISGRDCCSARSFAMRESIVSVLVRVRRSRVRKLAWAKSWRSLRCTSSERRGVDSVAPT